MTTVTIVAPSKCCHCNVADVHVYPLQADGVQCAHPECITAFHALQDDRRALEATAIALACVGKHGAEPPQKTAENKEIEDLPDLFDSDTEDDDGTEQVPYSAVDDIGEATNPNADVPYVRVSGHAHNAADYPFAYPFAQMWAGDNATTPWMIDASDPRFQMDLRRFVLIDGNSRITALVKLTSEHNGTDIWYSNTDDGEVPALVSDDDDDTIGTQSSHDDSGMSIQQIEMMFH